MWGQIRTAFSWAFRSDVDPAARTFARTPASNGRCQRLGAIHAVELATLPPIFEDVHPDTGLLRCELGAGHDRDHVALVATARGGDQWWWLRWDGSPGEVIEVIQIDPCDAELPQGRYADECLLPEGHPGPHSFDLLPPDGPC